MLYFPQTVCPVHRIEGKQSLVIIGVTSSPQYVMQHAKVARAIMKKQKVAIRNPPTGYSEREVRNIPVFTVPDGLFRLFLGNWFAFTIPMQVRLFRRFTTPLVSEQT
ncbi:MAG: hypothetical protein M3Q07_15860 [Pseudobdellovibrionaceae bacterium]|nr:hypothetical protein [Pseudobdellovibrionaceae bacterium]